jgi:NLR family CARD domain-containing protein 3
MAEVTAEPNRLPPPSPARSSYDEESSVSSLDDGPHETNKLTPPTHLYTSYTIEHHLSTLQGLQKDDFDNEAGINALPRRRNKSQRHLALQLAKELYPEMSDIAAIIQYERLTTPAKALVRQKQRERTHAQLQPKNNAGGKLLQIQGPWAGQEIDPVDLKGPVAIPMPVTIGKIQDFEPIFGFLAQNKGIDEAGDVQGTHGLELLWKNPILEFNRGIVYKDGRLDLCKKVVGPTHMYVYSPSMIFSLILPPYKCVKSYQYFMTPETCTSSLFFLN